MTYDVHLGDHVACTVTTRAAAEAIKKVFDAKASAMFQHGPCRIVPVDRGYVARKKPAKKTA